jgi:hypothetical protein
LGKCPFSTLPKKLNYKINVSCTVVPTNAEPSVLLLARGSLELLYTVMKEK